jgi:hypothetical protein
MLWMGIWEYSYADMSAKVGSHGGKDIAKVMAITDGSGNGET